MNRDWIEWHRAYDDPASVLNRRLAVVASMVRTFLDGAPPGPIRCLSLCAGRARDLAIGANDHPRRADLTGAAIELEPALAAAARVNLLAAGLALDVRSVDAARPANYDDLVPVDLLLLVGIFGNISTEDIERTVAAVPALCRPGAVVICHVIGVSPTSRRGSGRGSLQRGRRRPPSSREVPASSRSEARG